jgi:hypothetical protein
MACYPANIGLPGKGVEITYLCKRVFVSINFTHAKQNKGKQSKANIVSYAIVI